MVLLMCLFLIPLFSHHSMILDDQNSITSWNSVDVSYNVTFVKNFSFKKLFDPNLFNFILLVNLFPSLATLKNARTKRGILQRQSINQRLSIDCSVFFTLTFEQV